MDSPSRNDKSRAITEFHEYIVVYAKDKDQAGLSQQSEPEITEGYKIELPDGRSARARQLRKNGKGARREDRSTLWYPLDAPDGTQVYPIAPEGWEGRWVLTKESWEDRVQQGLGKWVKRDYGWEPNALSGGSGRHGFA